ncbi:hypothetical protein B0I35DRAFT_204712 [Stachybotrys elegans]|uniref:Uncharacterized protein n=1 Tax=Stachybotrys elegans TaxID=80388 RepID=A0A8K0SU61_9HYPO|nr:hypothetical protein B0I35DRAFT_204712 [Stachybotrys elegans]
MKGSCAVKTTSDDKPAKIADGPPLNAPREPASHRRASSSISTSESQIARACSLSDTGSWSQSKRWVSDEAKERMAFQKIMQNLRHIGADKSPFIPQTPAKMAAFRAEIADEEKRKLVLKVERRQAEAQAKAQNAGEKCPPLVQPMKLLGGKQFGDSLSTVFAAKNCFNDNIWDEGTSDGWPTLADFKSHRELVQTRSLPPPRSQMRPIGYERQKLQEEKAKVSNGHVKHSDALGAAMCPIANAFVDETEEIRFEDAPWQVQDLLEAIDKETIDQAVQTDEKTKEAGRRKNSKSAKEEENEAIAREYLKQFGGK